MNRSEPTGCLPVLGLLACFIVPGAVAYEWPRVSAFLKAYPSEVFTGAVLLVGVFLVLAGLGIRRYEMDNPGDYCADDGRKPWEEE